MIVYIAGPYRDATPEGIDRNIQAAREVAIQLIEQGYHVLTPHLNTIHFEKDCSAPDTAYLAMDLALLARCDALLLLPGWMHSLGAVQECGYAKFRGIPVYQWGDPEPLGEGDVLALPPLPPPSSTETRYPQQCDAFIQIVMGMYRTHLNKNQDYSPSNVAGPGVVGIVVRLWDKVVRLMSLSGYQIKVETEYTGLAHEPKNESIDDSFLDLAVYGVIGAIYRLGKWGK